MRLNDAMENAASRVSEACIDDALAKLVAAGLKAAKPSIRIILEAEQALDALGVQCDLIERVIKLEQRGQALGQPVGAMFQAVAASRGEVDITEL